MSDTIYYSNKYHTVRPERSIDRWLSSFNVFKNIKSNNVFNYDERPPYPILIANPTITQVIVNMNKSDLLVFGFCETLGLMSFAFLTRRINNLTLKFSLLSFNMITFTYFGLVMSTFGSYYRLIGLMDNGLTWKRKEKLFNKYDFTSDFESTTIFKHLRERPTEN